MDDYKLTEQQAETHEADGFGKTKSSDGLEIMNFWINIRKDSQIPEFDAINNLKWYSNGFEDQQELTNTVVRMATEHGGMFIADAVKLEDKDIFSMAGMDIHPKDRYPVASLRALKKAIYNYFDKTGQHDRLRKATQRIVCTCRHVTNLDIKDAVKRGKTDFESVRKFTGAGSGCGSCINKTKHLIQTFINSN